MNEINPLNSFSPNLQTSHKKTNTGEMGFSDRLKAAVDDVNKLQHSADNATQEVIKGNLGIHEGMLAMQEADLSLRLFLQVKNKVMDAYREIMRIA